MKWLAAISTATLTLRPSLFGSKAGQGEEGKRKMSLSARKEGKPWAGRFRRLGRELRKPHKTQAQASQTRPPATTRARTRRGHARYMNSHMFNRVKHSLYNATQWLPSAAMTSPVKRPTMTLDKSARWPTTFARNRITIFESPSVPWSMGWRFRWDCLLQPQCAAWQRQSLSDTAHPGRSIHSIEDNHRPEIPAKRLRGYQLEHQERFSHPHSRIWSDLIRLTYHQTFTDDCSRALSLP